MRMLLCRLMFSFLTLSRRCPLRGIRRWRSLKAGPRRGRQLASFALTTCWCWPSLSVFSAIATDALPVSTISDRFQPVERKQHAAKQVIGSIGASNG
jgi:hypothetical protein